MNSTQYVAEKLYTLLIRRYVHVCHFSCLGARTTKLNKNLQPVGGALCVVCIHSHADCRPCAAALIPGGHEKYYYGDGDPHARAARCSQYQSAWMQAENAGRPEVAARIRWVVQDVFYHSTVVIAAAEKAHRLRKSRRPRS